MMKRALWASGLLGLALVLGGCSDKDDRGTEEKLYAPAPEFATRNVMACSKCGAPQRPYRINGDKSFYRCTGQPPKFFAHPEEKWTHKINRSKDSTEQ
jgi:ssDNA-binding Zn-finger/Zn-ribbon topoisomerase 1